MNFDANQRKTITRRMLNIQVENAGYQNATSELSSVIAKLLQVEQANKVFYDFYDTQARSYEDEARAIDGVIPATYSESDVIAAAQATTYAPFFPDVTYTRFIPNISEYAQNYQIMGRFQSPQSKDSRYEQNILTNSFYYNSLNACSDLLQNAQSGSVALTTADPLSVLPADDTTTASINLTGGWTGGNDYVIIYSADNTKSGLYKITNHVGSNITVKAIIPSASTLPSGSNIVNNWAAFNATERQNLTHANWGEYLNNLATRITALVTEWQGKLNTQVTELTAQNDTRNTQNSQNVSALASAQAAYNATVTWLALSNTGTNGKFTVTKYTTLYAQITGRTASLAARITQIETALGNNSTDCITQSGNTFSTNVAGNSYYNRYFWLDVRINRLSGSLRRYYSTQNTSDQWTGMTTQNNNIYNQYAQYFVTKRLMASDGSEIAQLDNYTNISIGDIVYLVSETQPELELGVVELMGTNQVRFDKKIPNVYIKDDIARIFKLI